MAVLSGGLMMLLGCGGDDAGPGTDGPISSATLNPGDNSGGGGTAKSPTTNTNAPVDYNSLIKKTGAQPVIVGTNQFRLLYHFTDDNNRFSGLAKVKDPQGRTTIFRIEHGLKDGYQITRHPNSTNLLQRIRYIRGLKSGPENRFYPNGSKWVAGIWTNNLRTGHWFIWNQDGSTNQVDIWRNGLHIKRDVRFLSPGLARQWSGQQLQAAYIGQPASILRKAFGKPFDVRGPKVYYYYAKVSGVLDGKLATKIIFTVQNGKVTAVEFAE